MSEFNSEVGSVSSMETYVEHAFDIDSTCELTNGESMVLTLVSGTFRFNQAYLDFMYTDGELPAHVMEKIVNMLYREVSPDNAGDLEIKVRRR